MFRFWYFLPRGMPPMEFGVTKAEYGFNFSEMSHDADYDDLARYLQPTEYLIYEG